MFGIGKRHEEPIEVESLLEVIVTHDDGTVETVYSGHDLRECIHVKNAVVYGASGDVAQMEQTSDGEVRQAFRR